jgi:HD-GYP domain-containing protein (c-di-GMP phosphodiesterase class II)
MRELPDNYLIQVMEDVIEDLHGHVHRVSNLAVDLGRGLGLGEDDLDRLALAGVLHDVGKIHMDPEILGKPGPLDPSEKDLMERHPELGFAMTRNRLDPKIAEAILYHHERFDGRGYPFGLTGNAIPILSRIVLVADAFDAMTSTRAYQPALPIRPRCGRDLPRAGGGRRPPPRALRLIAFLMQGIRNTGSPPFSLSPNRPRSPRRR